MVVGACGSWSHCGWPIGNRVLRQKQTRDMPPGFCIPVSETHSPTRPHTLKAPLSPKIALPTELPKCLSMCWRVHIQTTKRGVLGCPLEGIEMDRGSSDRRNITLLNLTHFIPWERNHAEREVWGKTEIDQGRPCSLFPCKLLYRESRDHSIFFPLGRWWKGKNHRTPAASSGCALSPRTPWTC